MRSSSVGETFALPITLYVVGGVCLAASIPMLITADKWLIPGIIVGGSGIAMITAGIAMLPDYDEEKRTQVRIAGTRRRTHAPARELVIAGGLVY